MTETLETNKLKMHSPDLTLANIDKLAELFPNCVTEAEDDNGQLKRAIDFDQLRQELSDHVVDGPRERYRLDWPGKREAQLAANAPIAKTLRPCREESVDFDTTQNLFIEGDNLDALKLLQETYLNKIKMIYIDPPYNTGSDFVYNDKFSDNAADYFARSLQTDEHGNRLIANTESNGRFHSDWISMMYPRLKLARNVLASDGIVVVSIDDNEVANLCEICDEIFGTENFIGSVSWLKKRKGSFLSKTLVSVTEWLLIYGKSRGVKLYGGKADASESQPLIKRTNTVGTLKFPTDTISTKLDDGIYTKGHYGTGSSSVELLSDIEVNNGVIVTPVTLRGPFTWSQVYLDDQIDHGAKLIINTKSLQVRAFKADDPNSFKGLLSVIDGVKLGATNEDGYEELVQLLGAENTMSYPKPRKLIELLIKAQTHWDKTSIIVDFFAGSAATAHAVISSNASRPANCRFIMVQLPEVCSDDNGAFKAGFKTIADLSKERIRRAGQKVKQDNADKEGIDNLDIGFRVLKIDSSNMKDVYYAPDQVSQQDLLGQVDNIKEDRSDEDLLFQVLLDWGVDLSLPITPQTIAGKTVYFVDGNALAACFETGIDEAFVKALAEHKPLRAVFRDSGYGSDNTKINVEQIFKQLSPITEVKTL